MAAGTRSSRTAALFMYMLLSSMAERQVTELMSGRLAVVVQHRHLQRGALPPARARSAEVATDGAAQGRSKNETLEQGTAIDAGKRRQRERERETKKRDDRLAREVEMLNKTMLDKFGLEALPKLLRPEAAERAAATMLRSAAEDENEWVRKAAVTALEHLNPEAAKRAAPVVLKAAAEGNDYAMRDVAFQVLPKLLAPDAAEHAAPALLRMAAKDNQRWQEAGSVLSRLNSKAADRTLPVLLRSAAEDLDPWVRWAALHFLPKQLSPEAAARAAPVVLGIATEKEGSWLARGAAFQVLPEVLTPNSAQHAAPVLLRMAAKGKQWQWRQEAGSVLSRLNSKAADQALPVLLRSAAEDLDPKVRRAALQCLPKQLSPEAAQRAAHAISRAATEDLDPSVRLAAMEALPNVLGPEAAERARPVVLQAATEDEDPHVRAMAAAVAPRFFGHEAAEQAVHSLLRVVARDTDEEPRQSAMRALGDLVAGTWLSSHGAMEQNLPTLVMMLEVVDPYAARYEDAKALAIQVGRALAKVAPMAGPDALDALASVEKQAMTNSTADSQLIRLSRETVQKALEDKCARAFLKQTGISARVEDLATEVPAGVMMHSDAHSTHAYRCPNPVSCPVRPRQKMMPAKTNSTTKFKKGACPLLLQTPLRNIGENTSACTFGLDPATPGCTKCLPGFGRKNRDPFSCEPCGRADTQEDKRLIKDLPAGGAGKPSAQPVAPGGGPPHMAHPFKVSGDLVVGGLFAAIHGATDAAFHKMGLANVSAHHMASPRGQRTIGCPQAGSA
ncbi:unnamed protein product [Prorocentrum cordatum]|uniref:HEAT repeat-containing protein 1 n=1 Tax=Prorocentrum cordatum TaxID=2364126 RepID=A0ABN9X784_9DINO|nr:unnamed protein product [Polarella glacialis]